MSDPVAENGGSQLNAVAYKMEKIGDKLAELHTDSKVMTNQLANVATQLSGVASSTGHHTLWLSGLTGMAALVLGAIVLNWNAITARLTALETKAEVLDNLKSSVGELKTSVGGLQDSNKELALAVKRNGHLPEGPTKIMAGPPREDIEIQASLTAKNITGMEGNTIYLEWELPSPVDKDFAKTARMIGRISPQRIPPEFSYQLISRLAPDGKRCLFDLSSNQAALIRLKMEKTPLDINATVTCR